MKYTAIIIEDEKPAQLTLLSYIETYFKSEIEVGATLDSVKSTLTYLQDYDPSIIFIDIQLKDGLGIRILDDINPNKYCIVFTTAFDNYTIEAFKNKVFGYLLKPIDPTDFQEIVKRILIYLNHKSKDSKKIKVPHGIGFGYINVNDIIRCESSSNYTKLLCKQGEEYLLSKTLKVVEETIINSIDFVRVHHSHLVNLNYIDTNSIQSSSIRLVNGEEIPVSRSRKDNLLNLIRNRQ